MKKSNYSAAALIFGLLLLYRLYGAVGLLRSFVYQAPVSLMSNIAGLLLCVIPLAILLNNALKHKVNPKTKTTLAAMYILGIILPWVPSLMHIGLPPITALVIPIVCIVLFCVALFKLMGGAEEKTEDAVDAAGQERIAYYKDLLDSGVITKEEYEQMKKNIEQRN